jgi:hypothetical protein
MNPELEKLQTQKDKVERQIAQCEHRETLLKNRITYLDKGERRKRAHRLITRGAAVESIVPSIKSMGETEFYELMETILHLPEVIPLLPKDES